MTKPRNRICLLGEYGCGKTCLQVTLVGKEFPKLHHVTLGVRETRHSFPTQEDPNKRTEDVIVDDTSGEERYRESVTVTFVRRAQCVLICFDVSSERSFDEACAHWLPWAKTNARDTSRFILVGLKADLVRAVSTQVIHKLAESFDMEYFETSSKTRHGIQELSQRIGSYFRNRGELSLITHITEEWLSLT